MRLPRIFPGRQGHQLRRRQSPVTRAGVGLGLVLAAAAQLSCSEPASRCAPFDYSRYQARSQPSFRRDIRPVLAISCALSTSCHGTDQGRAPDNRPLLGPRAGITADEAAVTAILTDLRAPSDKAPALSRVSPGRPQDSFLLHKLDGSQACAGLGCPGGCGGRMPLLGDPLPPTEIDKIRDWILQGAPDN